MEKWKVIEGYPYYEVSNRGQVRSLPRLVRCRGGGSRLVVGGIRKLCKVPGGGYYVVSLHNDGGQKRFYIHRLVLDAFRGPKPNPRMVCRHLDGDPTNNRRSNLVWGTCQENADDMRRHGTVDRPAGEKHPCAKLTDKKVLRIRKLYATGEYTLAAIATAYGVTAVCVRDVVRRITWKHLRGAISDAGGKSEFVM